MSRTKHANSSVSKALELSYQELARLAHAYPLPPLDASASFCGGGAIITATAMVVGVAWPGWKWNPRARWAQTWMPFLHMRPVN